MKKYQYVGILAISLFSFYYTDKIATMTLNNNEIYQSIKNVAQDYESEAINAVIDDNYIIPGINGTKVNIKTSFYNMKDLNTFNEYYLVYDKTVPSISLENNKDKIINKGNTFKKSVAILFEYDQELIKYFKENEIDVSILINKDTFNKDETLEQINNDQINYKEVDILLNKYNKNTNICFIDNLNEELCLDKYKVSTNNILTNSTFIKIKNDIEAGNIYYIKKGTSKSNIKLLINSIIYKDLDIIRLSKLISEEID